MLQFSSTGECFASLAENQFVKVTVLDLVSNLYLYLINIYHFLGSECSYSKL